jgi:hypothetical protein
VRRLRAYLDHSKYRGGVDADSSDPSPSTSQWEAWLDRPLRRLPRLASWLTATAAFIGVILVLGGPSEGDAAESVYSTWAIAYGHWSCAYPPPSKYIFPNIASPFSLIGPLYPLLSGGLAALLRIGDAAPFPSTATLGTHCSAGFAAMYQWSGRASAILPTIRLGYLSWLVLMAGIIFFLRTSGRGRRGWEAATVVLVAVAPPVWMCVLRFFHPQDLLALGLAVGGLACVVRGKWLWAGVLLGLAFTAQQFSLLVIAPLFVLAPWREKFRMAAAAVSSWALIVLPLATFTSGRVLKEALFGSSRVGSVHRGLGGTVLWEVDLHGVPLFFIARALPILLSMVLAWWVGRKLGARSMEPLVLASLVATSLCLRLLFEVNLFGYYFMAVTVMLILIDTLRGRVRGPTWAWIALVTVAFNPVPWLFASNATSYGYTLYRALPIVIAVVVLLLLVLDALRRRVQPYLVGLLVIIALTRFPAIWGLPPVDQVVPGWFWQVVLVPIGLTMAARPLFSATIKENDPHALDEVVR